MRQTSPILALVAFSMIGCGAPAPVAAEPHCVLLPVLFDWQALDPRTVIVWPSMTNSILEMSLSAPIDALGSEDVRLELVDGDRDGSICDHGFDTVVAWDSSSQDESGEQSLGSAEVYFLAPLNALAVAERQVTYAATLGPRQHNGTSDE